jgi:adenylate kinase
MNTVRYCVLSLVMLLVPGCRFFSSSEENKPAAERSKVIISFLGAPGSGKGTLAERCVKELGCEVLSTGNLCRKHIAEKTQQGLMIEQYSKQGKLVPDEVINEMVDGWLKEAATKHDCIILDGYPRTAKQAEMLIEMLQKKYKDYCLRVINLSISNEAIIKRISQRLVCSNKACQAVYNESMLKDKSMKCFACQAPLIRREDDKEDVVRERLNVYDAHNKPLVEYYHSIKFPIEDLIVENKTVDEIFVEFKELMAHGASSCGAFLAAKTAEHAVPVAVK